MRVAYNITFILDTNHVDHWRKWMAKEFLPLLMGTGCFLNFGFLKLIGLHGSDDPTYSVQLILQNKAMVSRYQTAYESEHNSFLQSRFKDNLGKFPSILIYREYCCDVRGI